MSVQTGIVELVTKSELLELELASWNRPRTTEQLLGFITRREAEAFDDEQEE